MGLFVTTKSLLTCWDTVLDVGKSLLASVPFQLFHGVRHGFANVLGVPDQREYCHWRKSAVLEWCTHRTDHHLDHLDHLDKYLTSQTCADQADDLDNLDHLDAIVRACIVHIQRRKDVIDGAAQGWNGAYTGHNMIYICIIWTMWIFTCRFGVLCKMCTV